MKISLIVLRCKDVKKSKLFYERLGCVFQKERHGNGEKHYAFESEGMVFELYPAKDITSTDHTRLGFTVENVDMIIKDLEVINTYRFKHHKIYVVKDPDGRKIELS